MSKVVEILIAAKAEIVKQGWRQGQRFADPDGGWPRMRLPGCCASDAFIDARVTHNFSEADIIVAFDVLGKALHTVAEPTGLVFELIGWNDAHGRTVEEVYALYDKAIGAARAQAGGP